MNSGDRLSKYRHYQRIYGVNTGELHAISYQIRRDSLLMPHGIPPYLIAYRMKLPGIYAIYALIMSIFGQTITGIHLGLMIANSIAIALLFLLTRYLFDKTAAIIAAISYALISLNPSVLGTSAHATQFI